jgi:amino acid adenylation domain-containing protein/non-ribosomal peptide synthase protein (TIGR01720 family)
MFTEVIDLLSAARRNGITISLEGEKLRLKVPPDRVVDKELLDSIKKHKDRIIDFLQDKRWRAGTDMGNDTVPLPLAKTVDKVPLSFAQERLWFIDKLHGSLQYQTPWIFRLTGSLDHEALEWALKQIIYRHEVLRTMIREEDGIGYQVVVPAHTWGIKYLRETELTERGYTIQSFIEEELERPFDLSEDIKLRGSLIRVGENEHLLVALVHHIAFDGWSIGILVEELSALYRGRIEQDVPSLKEMKLQYADWALWQKQYLSGALMERKLSYWKNQLDGARDLDLLTDFVRPVKQRMQGGRIKRVLDKGLRNRISTLLQQEDATLYMLLLSVFKVLIYRHNGHADICIGSPVAGRQRQEWEGLIGFFINMLPLRTAIRGDISFRALLQEVKQTTLDAFANQELPFEKIVEALEVPREVNRNPLFQVTFTLQNLPEEKPLDLGGLSLKAEDIHSDTAQFDLQLVVAESSGAIEMTMAYSSDLYRETTVQRMLEHYEHLLESVLKDINRPLDELNMLSAEEEILLKGINEVSSIYPAEAALMGLFEAQVAETPDAVALVFEEDVLTYYELNRRANQLGHYLQAKGVGADSLVAVCLPRCTSLIVSILGILKAGGSYVPIDPEYPGDRIQHMLDDSGSSLLITESLLVETLAAASCGRLELDREAEAIGLSSCGNTVNAAGAGSTAYLMYTSGSTGRPKGVVVSHRNIVSLVKGVSYVELSATSVLLGTGSPSFDAVTFEYWGMLLNGGRLVLCSQETLLDPILLKTLIREQQITSMWFTAGWFNQLVEADITLFVSLKTILVGGDRLSRTHIDKVRNEYPGLVIINGYGPTENTTFSLSYVVSGSVERGELPIGKPLDNRTAYILDGRRELCGIGIKGELYVGGVGLSSGYWQQAELTASRFITVPGLGELYRTGDLARYRSDGNIEFLGRLDDQVKIRGFRIEPGEVSYALEQVSGIKQALTLVLSDQEGGKHLVSYIVSTDLSPDLEQIREELSAHLPDYMIPSQVIALDSFPLTANGKIDRKSLPVADLSVSGNKDVYEAPRNELEQALAGIWEHLLGVERVGIHDDFFKLGGHSLLAIQFISAVRSQLSKEITIRDVFEYATLSGLSERLSVSGSSDLLPSVGVRNLTGKIPLSFSQERLWFIDKLQGSVQYHMPWVFRLKGQLDVAGLEWSFRQIILRHEVLRTVILEEDGVGYQEITARPDWHLKVTDRTIIPKEESLEDYIQELIHTPLDLSSDLMLKASLIRLSEEEYILVAITHHIAFDGWSISILVQELAELYRSRQERHPAQLSVLPVQYADYAVWQRGYLLGEVLEEKLSYWREQLKDVTPLGLPTDYARPEEQSIRGSVVHRRLSVPLQERLLSLSQAEDVTLFMTLLAVFKVLLYRYSGQEDICVGSPVAGRQQQETEGLVGFFVNALALRAEVKGQQVFREFLQKIKKTTLAAYAHQAVPFEKIVEALGLARDTSRSPLFQVKIGLHNMPVSENLDLSGIQLDMVGHEHTTSQLDISLDIMESSAGLLIDLTYCSDLYRKDTIERMLDHYERLLIAVTENTDIPIGKLSMLTATETEQLLGAFNHTILDYPKEKSIVDLFEEQVLRMLDEPAIIFEREQLTYRQLNERSNQLGHFLRTKGIREESLVAICLDRSPDMIISILAVLKAGGAYLPIDPDYPSERINYMLEDSACTMIIASSYLQDVFDGQTAKAICLDTLEDMMTLLPSGNVVNDVTVHSLAYVIYTSGSTGRPKGVMIEHRNVMNLVYNQVQPLQLRKGIRVFQFASFSFDASCHEIFCTLLHGGVLVLAPKPVIMDPVQLAALLEEQQIELVTLPPSYQNVFQIENHYVRTVISAGEPLSPGLAQGLIQKGIKVINAYGPTENTVSAILSESPLHDSGIVTIGKPIGNIRAYILDDHLQPVPIGVTAHLYLGGPQLARGYLNQPGLTAERFITHSFISEEHVRLYKTGDLAYWLPDGNIAFMGRIDDQVKLRGYRIELSEVENVLQQAPGVNQAAVVLQEDSRSNKHLAAYLVVNGEFEKEAAQAFLQARLPDYMIPYSLTVMEILPLTPSGKVDKKVLAKMEAGQPLLNTYAAPRNELEQQLADIWKELLGAEQVGIDDNFFELGGDSIITIQVVSRARRLGYELRPGDIFQYQTISELARVIMSQQQAVIDTKEQGLLSGDLGLLPIQQWFLENNDEDISHYNQSILLRIDKDVSPGMLEEAVKVLVQHHDSLRLSYRKTTTFWEQSYCNREGSLEVIDISDMTSGELRDVISAASDHAQASLNIQEGKLVKFLLMLTPPMQHQNRLLIVIHHLGTDGVSWRILLEDLELMLSGNKADEEFVLGSKSSSCRQWSQALEQYGKTNRLLSQRTYWEQVVQGYRPLPVDKPGERYGKTTDKHKHTVKLSPELTRSLVQKVPKTYHTEINDILLGALAKTLTDWCKEEQVVIGLEGHGREEIMAGIDLSRTTGWFTNLYPVCLTAEPSLENLIKHTKEQLRRVPDKGIGYGVLKYLQQERIWNKEDPWDIVFNYLGQVDNIVSKSSRLTVSGEPYGNPVGANISWKNKLEVNGVIVDGELILDWSYSKKHYERETIMELAYEYINNLKAIIEHCLEQDQQGRTIYTPADYGLSSEVSYQELDEFLNKDDSQLDGLMQF